jgi:hypothetical protein
MVKGDKIKYRKGYKYQLSETYSVYVGILINCETEWITLFNGWLTIRKGYAWDGASGPTFDTKNSMRGSLVHDALYQLLRLGLLSPTFRAKVDDLLHNLCVEDGMFHIRAELWEEAVSHFAASSAAAGHEPVELEAP